MVQVVSRYRWVILGLSLLCQVSAALAGQVVAPLAPLFQPELGLSKAEVGLFASAAFAGAWCVLLVAGSLTDRFGNRKMMSIGQVVTGFLLLSMSMVVTAFQAAAVMFAAGLGRGTVFPGSTKAIMEWFPPTNRATAMGVKQTGAPIAGILTAATLPALALVVGWRSAIAMVGFVVVAAGIVTAILYKSPRESTLAPERKASMRAGLTDVIRNRSLWTVGSIAFVYVAAQMGLITYLALYLKEVVLVPVVPDESARIVAAGGYLAFCQMGGVVGRILWGMVSDRVFQGRRIVVLAIVGAISALMSLGMGYILPGPPMWLLGAIVFAFGVSAVGWNGVFHTLVAETAGRKYAATGVGLCLTMVESGTTIGPPLFGLIVDVTGTYRSGWLFLTCLFALGTVVATLLARGEKRAA